MTPTGVAGWMPCLMSPQGTDETPKTPNMTTTKNDATISERCWKSDQSWHYQHTFHCGDAKLRTTIRRNAYDFQSSAKVERWDGAKWHTVVTAPITELPCAQISYVTRGITAADFSDSALRLEDEAREVIA